VLLPALPELQVPQVDTALLPHKATQANRLKDTPANPVRQANHHKDTPASPGNHHKDTPANPASRLRDTQVSKGVSQVNRPRDTPVNLLKGTLVRLRRGTRVSRLRVHRLLGRNRVRAPRRLLGLWIPLLSLIS
jgi:hypothetical protein